MKIKIILSTGGVAYVPYIQTVPEWWPNYTVTRASPNPGGGS